MSHHYQFLAYLWDAIWPSNKRDNVHKTLIITFICPELKIDEQSLSLFCASLSAIMLTILYNTWLITASSLTNCLRLNQCLRILRFQIFEVICHNLQVIPVRPYKQDTIILTFYCLQYYLRRSKLLFGVV